MPMSSAHRAQLAPPLPNPGHRSPELFVGDVEVSLRLLDVGMTKHQLNGADIDAVGQEPASAFVTEVVPVQIDLPQLLPVHSAALLRANDIVTVRP